MKLKYLIPFIGLIFISNDIPHTENQRRFKPLQGDDVMFVTIASWCSTFASAIALFLLFSSK